MLTSAENTIAFLELNFGLKALLPISADRIGGKMMLVRALIRNWDLEIIEPTSNLEQIVREKNFDFTALVPLQASLLYESSSELLEKIECIIIGGASINNSLEEKLNELSNRVYHTYGMTETVSHIALRKLSQNQSSKHFEVIGDNMIDLSKDGLLQIKGAVTNNIWITTNDLVDISDNTFAWLARTDLVINSGGVKLQIEEIEGALNKVKPSSIDGNLCIWKSLDEQLGEKVVCICDNPELIKYFVNHTSELKSKFIQNGWPKKWHHIPSIILTPSGKIDRVKSLAQSFLVSA